MQFDLEPDCPRITDDAYKTAVEIIRRLDVIDRENVDEAGVLGERPAVLVFLPGFHEIETMEKTLSEMRCGTTV